MNDLGTGCWQDRNNIHTILYMSNIIDREIRAIDFCQSPPFPVSEFCSDIDVHIMGCFEIPCQVNISAYNKFHMPDVAPPTDTAEEKLTG